MPESKINKNCCSIFIYAAPLGNITTRWIIPISLFNNKQAITIPFINYKYVLSEIMRVPVPLSYKAIPIESEVLKCVSTDEGEKELQTIPYKVESDFLMNKYLKADLKGIQIGESSKENLTIEYLSKGLVNSDGIFFKIVYPIVNILDSVIDLKIDLQAHFSYGIRRHKFYTMFFDSVSSKEIKLNADFDVVKSQDIVLVKVDTVKLKPGEQIDLHLQASRLPFIIKKDYFWIGIFILVILLALAPIINLIRSFL